MRPLRLLWLFFRIGALNELQYRANFALQILQSAIAVGTGLAVLALVFSQTPSLNGWTQAELLAVLGVFTLMGGLIGTIIQPNMEKLREDIRLGTFDFVLTKPEDIQVLSSVREVKIWQAVDILVGVVVLGYAIGQLQSTIGWLEAIAFGVALVLGGVMIYCFWLVLTTIAFWIVRVDEIAELFEGVYQTGRWPVTVYPGWLRYSVTFLVPVGLAVTVPAEAVTSRLHALTLLGAAGFAALLFGLTRWFWRYGLRRYSGASA
jgi:ABC-2 type transport system permease protein